MTIKPCDKRLDMLSLSIKDLFGTVSSQEEVKQVVLNTLKGCCADVNRVQVNVTLSEKGAVEGIKISNLPQDLGIIDVSYS